MSQKTIGLLLAFIGILLLKYDYRISGFVVVTVGFINIFYKKQ